MIDRRLIQHFDWALLALLFLSAAVGVMTLYSAVTAGAETGMRTLYLRQLMWLGLGFIAMTVGFSIDYRFLNRWAPMLYLGVVLLLVFVLFFGKYVGGSRRWIALGPVSVQPSEFMKLALVILLASYYEKRVETDGFTFRGLIAPFFFTAVPFTLIVLQPDLGTAMVLLLIAGSITFFVRIEKKTLVMLVGSVVPLGFVAWRLLRDYQRQRILTFFDPNGDPLGTGYHIIQSKIAVGSGMVWGKGFVEGTQNALSFLPEQHTDFIFSVLAEEWGFVGAGAVVILFLLFVFRGLSIAHRCRDSFGVILAVGISAMIFWQAFINIAMVMGMMPVVGVPLPFISYGGSSAITLMVSVGILMGVSMRRFRID
jgi:rod shape determining protein RodA